MEEARSYYGGATLQESKSQNNLPGRSFVRNHSQALYDPASENLKLKTAELDKISRELNR